jgi:RNA polymerase sigma-70 factor, ECF subfamily
MNKTAPNPVFMIEGRRVLAGEAILSCASAIERGKEEVSNAECSRPKSIDEAIEALVHEHARLVYRIAYAALRQHQDAEDATQEVFLRILRYRSKLAGVEDAKTWLARIAWRVAVERSKRRRTGESSIENENAAVDIAASAPIADTTVQQAEVATIVKRLIQALPENLRQPLILSTLEEMSPKEAAAVLGIKDSTVRSRVFRARQILKEKLMERIGNRG